jgi:hypothetical protein
MPLNRNKPFGQVYNHPAAHFEQDGKLFDAHGRDIEPQIIVQPIVQPILPEKRGPGRPRKTLPWGARQ